MFPPEVIPLQSAMWKSGHRFSSEIAWASKESRAATELWWGHLKRSRSKEKRYSGARICAGTTRFLSCRSVARPMPNEADLHCLPTEPFFRAIERAYLTPRTMGRAGKTPQAPRSTTLPTSSGRFRPYASSRRPRRSLSRQTKTAWPSCQCIDFAKPRRKASVWIDALCSRIDFAKPRREGPRSDRCFPARTARTRMHAP